MVGIDVPAVLRSLTGEDRTLLLIAVPLILITLILARFLFVFAMAAIAKTRVTHPRSWIVVAWAGTRGPISALAAFTLPLTTADGAPFPQRDLIISITFCVVVLSLLLAPTMGPLAHALHLPEDDDTETMQRVQIALARASLDRLDEISLAGDRAKEPIPAETLDQLRGGVERRLELLSREHDGHADDVADPTLVREVRLSMVHAEQEELLRMRDEEGLPDALMRIFQKELDVRARAVQSL